MCLPLAKIALVSSARQLLLADAEKWVEYSGLPPSVPSANDSEVVAALAASSRAFRNLLYYRLGHDSRVWTSLLLPILRAIWRPLQTLRFYPDSLGPGCFILHGYGTGVVARSIGANFVVGQHVVIGYKAAGEYPTIGDNVRVFVGAIVIGDISIGDGATVGAGAVVVHDVPAGVTVVGEAAHPIGDRRQTG